MAVPARRERPEHQENSDGAHESTQTRLGMRKRGSSYLPFTRKRRQQNAIIPKKKKPAENIDGFVSGLKARRKAGLFSFNKWT
ncbi:hypothetical protein ACQZ46_18940, partial [Agrobacterium salinitolerans]